MNCDVIPLRDKDIVPFRCQLCAQCCKNIPDGLMLEPLDAFRIAKYLRGREGWSQIQSVEDVYSWFTHISMLEDLFPIYLMNTRKEEQDCCVFLENDRCMVYKARPRACRIYPFSVDVGQRGKVFNYFQCIDHNAAHFGEGSVAVKDWMYENFSKEDRAYLTLAADAMPRLGQLLRALTPEQRKERYFQCLYYFYFNYQMDQPFLPQYRANVDKLCDELQSKLNGKG